MPPPRTAARYCARDGSRHDVLVLTTPAGRWRILDTTETTVVHVETLTGIDDLLSQATALARDYATRRFAFGKRLLDHPLHAETLAAMELEWRAGFLLAFHVVELLGRQETATAAPQDLSRLRLLIPVAKLFTAKQAVAVASEALESFGGAGYIEEYKIGRMWRDQRLLRIGGGTTETMRYYIAKLMGL